MEAEVVVVGGGIGGLTVAALLAARGLDVCLLERESRVGGCAASFEKFGYSFDQGYGLYACWEAGEIHHRVFSELPVDPPETRLLDSSYTVRLPEQTEVSLTSDQSAFEKNLSLAFPDCAPAAISFYKELAKLNTMYRRLLHHTPDFVEAARPRKRFSFLPVAKEVNQILEASQQTALAKLDGTSFRFRRFIDVQLQALGYATGENLSYLYAALLLDSARGGMFGMRGGAAALALRLEESIRKSGGRVRLNTPALRLSYNSAGEAVGVDLLSGETVTSSRAIVSNLTVWDTYGKLVGMNRTPAEVRQHLKSIRGWGVYQMYLGWDQTTADASIPDRLLTLNAWNEGEDYDAPNNQTFFCSTPHWDPRAPEGKRAVTVHTFTDVDDWFTYHTDESDLETQDQQTLEACWTRLHAAIPELGDTVEVIETANPRTLYEQTRRKLGMVGNLPAGIDCLSVTNPLFHTSLPNLFIISDTASYGGLAGLTHSAKALCDHLVK